MILRPRRLADALAANALSEREKFHYLLLWAVAGTLLSAGVGTWGPWTRSRVASLVLLAVVTVFGLIICFRANARGDNRAFLERYVWIDSEAHGWNRDAMSLVAGLIAAAIYYLWLRQLLTRAAGARTA
jgi:hypothetical protein